MKLFYSVNCGKNCEYYSDEHKKEKWKDAKLYGKDRKKSIRHRDNNSYNFNPDNMLFGENHPNGQPHLYRTNIDEWDKLIEKICKK